MGKSVKILLSWWRVLGRVLGDGEYLRYCEHMRARHPERVLPTAKEFYLARLEEKYSRPSRCC
jgi:uncharacterized short protein YbdD (DUF466 family)